MTHVQKTFTLSNTHNIYDAETKPVNAPKDLTMELHSIMKRLRPVLKHTQDVQKILLKKLRKKYANRSIPMEEMHLLWLDAQAMVLPFNTDRHARYLEQRKVLLAKIALYIPPTVPVPSTPYAASKRLKERYAAGNHTNSWALANEKRKHKIQMTCEALLRCKRP